MHLRSVCSLALLTGATSGLALVFPQVTVRADASTTALVTFSSVSFLPSPTQTDAAAASEYSDYVVHCGTDMAQMYQTELAKYNSDVPSDPPMTDINNSSFFAYIIGDPTYQNVKNTCDQDVLNIDALNEPGHSATTSSITSGRPTPGGASPSQASTKSNGAVYGSTPKAFAPFAVVGLLGGWNLYLSMA